VKRTRGDLLLAHGRDPYFAGWPDTRQLDYSRPATQEAMITELLKIAGQCDGVRCDMAMLARQDKVLQGPKERVRKKLRQGWCGGEVLRSSLSSELMKDGEGG